MTSPGPRFRTVGSVPTFLFFYKLTYLYWALWAATESNPLRGGGCESGHAQSGTLLNQEGRPTELIKTKKKGERGQS